MTQEQQQLLRAIYVKLERITEIGQVTENYHIRDLAHEAIDDLLKLSDLLTSEKEGEYYLSDDCSTKSEDGGDEGFNEFVKENYK